MHHVKKIAVRACYKANIFMICWKFHQHRQFINIWGYPQFWGHPRQAIFHWKSIRTKNCVLIISFGSSESSTLSFDNFFWRFWKSNFGLYKISRSKIGSVKSSQCKNAGAKNITSSIFRRLKQPTQKCVRWLKNLSSI